MNDRPSLASLWPWLRVTQWATIAVLIVVSELAVWSGHAGASYAVDGFALAAYFGFRQMGRSRARS